jgi:transglutaminase-like putative cysteine protease
MINQAKKINFSIPDLRLDDVLVEEYTIVTEFDNESFLDKKFFRFSRTLPVAYWYYSDFTLSFINNRKEELVVRKKYFRDQEGKQLPPEDVAVPKGETYHFQQLSFQTTYKENVLFEEIEVASKATWGEVGNAIYELYHDKLASLSLAKHKVFKELKLDDTNISLSEKIQAAIEYTQDRIVYLYDQEVMHGHVPEESSVTLEKRAGDCKAKSLLLSNLLTCIGVKSEIILVNYSADYFLGSFLPSPFIFNHAIVRIFWEDKIYLVDPTWSDRRGELSQRAEPYMQYYFPINGDEHSALVYEKERIVSGVNLEEMVQISLKENTGEITIDGTYQRESADIVRNNFRKLPESQNLLSENRMVLARFSYTTLREPEALLQDVSFRIISDDQKTNTVKTQYRARLVDPYEKSGSYRVIKHYYSFDIEQMLNYRHKEVPCFNFVAYPIRYRVQISSDLFVNKSPQLKKSTFIDNEHFQFANSKELHLKEVVLTASYTPKKYTHINTAEFETIKKEYQKISESNFGVGVVYLTLTQFIQSKWYFLILFFYLLSMLLGLLGDHHV